MKDHAFQDAENSFRRAAYEARLTADETNKAVREAEKLRATELPYELKDVRDKLEGLADTSDPLLQQVLKENDQLGHVTDNFLAAIDNFGRDSNEAGLKAAANLLEGKKELIQSLEGIGEGALSALAPLAPYLDKGHLRSEIEAARKKTEKTSARANAPLIGSATFNIRQDFKDQDPDRIIQVFREDIVKAATSRTSGNVGMFGVG
jgi:hypothetical protein